jgi:hypothetical protein
MKKAMFVFLFTGFAVLCFAKGSLELYGGMPFNFENTSAGEASMRSFSVGFAGVSPINDFIGFGAYFDVVFPQELKATTGGATVTTKPSDYNSIFGTEMVFGPVFTVYQKGKIRIPAAVGIHYIFLGSNTGPVLTTGWEFGLGGNIGCEYHFTEKWYAVGRVTVNWDFYAITRIETAYGTVTDSGTFTGVGFAPQIGFGYKF